MLNSEEQSSLTNKRSRLSPTQHTSISGTYHYESDCSSYCLPCFWTFIIMSILCVLTVGIVIGGYYVVLEGIKNKNYANSFNIEGNCSIINVQVKGANTMIVDYRVSKKEDSTSFPCGIGHEFTETYDNTQDNDFPVGSSSNCWTNSKCHVIYLDKDNNDKDQLSTFLSIAATIIFMIALCGIYCIYYGCINIVEPKKYWNAVNEDYHNYRDFNDNYINGKNEFYKYHWKQVMDKNGRFDYVMSNWLRQCDGIWIVYDVESLIYQYLHGNDSNEDDDEEEEYSMEWEVGLYCYIGCETVYGVIIDMMEGNDMRLKVVDLFEQRIRFVNKTRLSLIKDEKTKAIVSSQYNQYLEMAKQQNQDSEVDDCSDYNF